ncbi:MAG: hypothetical protein RTU63_13615 [Candidatus Thorarchaeota archaeon]
MSVNPSLTVYQITNNDYDDINPQIDMQFTWQGFVDGNWEIFWYDPVLLDVRLTTNNYDDINPKISEGQITWEGQVDDDLDGTPDDWEVFLYDGVSNIQLTVNDFDDINPQTHAGHVTWQSFLHDEGDYWPNWEIFWYDGISTIRFTDSYDSITSRESDVNPQIHDGQIIWLNEYDICLNYPYDYGWWTDKSVIGGGGFSFDRHDDGFPEPWVDHEVEPLIEDDCATWRFGDEVYLATPDIHRYQLILTEASNLGHPQMSSGTIVFSGMIDGHYEIFHRVSDSTVPQIDSPQDMAFAEGTAGLELRWEFSDQNPGTVSVTLDGEIVQNQGYWSEGPWDLYGYAKISLDGLSPGIHLYECTVSDMAGLSSSDVVEVTVWPKIDDKPAWVNPPTDQVIEYGDFLDYSIAATDHLGENPGIGLWWINDTANFELSSIHYEGGSTATITSKGILAVGDYGLKVIVPDRDGNILEGEFCVHVIELQEPGSLYLQLSGNFDYLLKEDIHFQLAAILLDSIAGNPVTGATITFDIFGPDGSITVSGNLAESTAPGVYVFTQLDTMKDDKIGWPKGIYLVYARAISPDGLESVDMIQFHVDPPGESNSNFTMNLGWVGFSGLAIVNIVIIAVFVVKHKGFRWSR